MSMTEFYKKAWPERVRLLNTYDGTPRQRFQQYESEVEHGLVINNLINNGINPDLLWNGRVAYQLATNHHGDSTLSPYFQSGSDLICDVLHNDSFDLFCEFGAGVGQNIANIVSRVDANYLPPIVATDIVDEAVDFMDKMFGSNLLSLKLDFRTPEFSHFPDANKPLFWTCNAIEQIDFLPKNFFDLLMEKYETGLFIHTEPVGLQIKGDQGCDPIQRMFNSRSSFNKNLIELLETNDKIKILEKRKNYFGGQYANPNCLVVWSW